MHTRFIPRLLVVSLMLAFIGTSLFRASVGAGDRVEWTDTESMENALVQSCYGFNITGSYTVNRAIQLVEEYTGRLVYERRDVSFSGALGDATTGKSYEYNGQYTRTGNPLQSKFKFSDLSLRFEVDTPGEFTVSLSRVDFNLSDNPHLIVKTVLQNALRMDVCQLFGGSAIGYDPIKPSSHPSADMNAENIDLRLPAIHTENSAVSEADESHTCANRARPGVPLPC